MTTYSYSRLSAVEKCPFSYCQRYSAKNRPDSQSIEAYVGTVVHSVVESDHENLIHDLEFIERVDHDFRDGHDPRKHYDPREWGFDHWHGHALSCAQHYLSMGRLAEGDELVGIERRFEMGLAGVDRIMGITDRVARIGGEIEVHDFKTGKEQQRRYFMQDMQLPLYSALVVDELELDPAIRMRCARYYLSTGKVAEIFVDAEKRRGAIDWARTRAGQAQKLEAMFAKTKDADTVESPLCSWCNYRDTICPAFN